ncbi:retroviral-like aspartic protease family protein [Massilia phyllostachyos]|uniref:retroviral-like aspartic protease family protein n=1 Tax=Massilia phyllostachyos TaxID=2898585 RepID=UPI0023430A13|nr:retroviral-like aspartic protease family protein [Massilia phyllostachyos]
MHPLARALACAALLAAASVQAQAIDPNGCLYVNVASVPVHYTGPSLNLTMDGSINGTPAQLLVDTGASDTALTRTGTEPRGMSLWSTGASSVGIGGYSRIYRTRYKEFRAGPATASSGELRVIHDFGVPPDFDGLVGAPFLLQSDFEISLAEKELRFFRPRNCGGRFLAYWDQDAVVVPFESSWSSSPNPQFTVLLNGKKLNAVIDSGASVTSVTLAAARRAGMKLDAPNVERLGESAGVGDTRVARWGATFDTLQIGGEIIRNAAVGVLDASFGDIDLLLGADFLRAHRVLFAMSQRKLYISYVGGEPLGQRRGIEPWMQKEAEAGNSDAQMMLSSMYRSGHGVTADPVQARAWFDRAAAAGNPRANFTIGRAAMGRGDYEEAARRLRTGLRGLPGDRIAALWLYVVRLRLGEGEAARADLEKTFARDDNDQWPKAVARYLLGKRSLDDVLDDAREDKPHANAQACFARTAIAEYHAALGEADRAKAMLAQRPECAPPPKAT